MESRELGRRLRTARKARGLSQQAVADELGLPRTAVTQMEAGNRAVSTLELAKLSSLHLLPVAHLLRQDGAHPDEGDALVVLYRLAPELKRDPATRERVARWMGLCREGATLMRLLGAGCRANPPKYDVSLPRSSWDAVAQGEQLAQQERQRLGIGNGPVANIVQLIASQGIWASGIPLPGGMSGAFLCHQTIGLAILVNASHATGRERLSYGHEYAHALLDRDRGSSVSSKDSSTEMIERRANAFASAFLMPRSGVSEVLQGLNKGGLRGRREQTVFDVASGGYTDAASRLPAGAQRVGYQDIAVLAHRFGVSYQAALFRLKSLRQVNEPESRSLLNQENLGHEYLQQLGMLGDIEAPESRACEDRELRCEIAHLAIEAYRLEEISRGRVLELAKALNVEGHMLLRLANAARGE